MGKKKHAEEHVNLERWLVSYADFITLLFATFVVLYALSQTDIAQYKDLEKSLKAAFSAPSVLQGSDGVMDSSGNSILAEGGGADSAIPPILENMSVKYEDSSFNQIKDSVDALSKKGEIDSVNTKIDERGLVITFLDLDLFFDSGSATLKKGAYNTIEKVAKLISEKFASHSIRVEGYTDNYPISSAIYPSNWELSSARASSVVRFLTGKFNFKEGRFSAVGYADTKPIASNNTPDGRKKNRRVDIVIIRNKYSTTEPKSSEVLNSKLKEQPIASEQNIKPQLDDKTSNAVVIKDPYDVESKKLANELHDKETKTKNNLDTGAVVLVKDKSNGDSYVSDAAKKLLMDVHTETVQPSIDKKNTAKPKTTAATANKHKDTPQALKPSTDEDIVNKLFHKLDNIGQLPKH